MWVESNLLVGTILWLLDLSLVLLAIKLMNLVSPTLEHKKIGAWSTLGLGINCWFSLMSGFGMVLVVV